MATCFLTFSREVSSRLASNSNSIIWVPAVSIASLSNGIQVPYRIVNHTSKFHQALLRASVELRAGLADSVVIPFRSMKLLSLRKTSAGFSARPSKFTFFSRKRKQTTGFVNG